MELPDKPEGSVPLYAGGPDDPNRKQIGWVKVDNSDEVHEARISTEIAGELFKNDIIDLSIINEKTPKEKN